MSAPSAAVTPALRRLNVPFIAALGVVVAGYAVAFFVLNAVIPVEQMAGTLAALVLGGGPYVQRAIERRLRVPPGPVPTREGYLKPWWLLFALGAVAVWVALSSAVYLSFRGGPNTAVVSSVDAVLRALGPVAAIAVGVGAAQRSDRFPLAVALAAVVVGWLAYTLTLDLVLGSATGGPVPPSGSPGAPPGVEFPPDPRDDILGGGALADLLTGQLPLVLASAMLGYWYGTRTRLQAYLGGLLRDVPPEDRDAIVDLAYDAARARSADEARPNP